MKNKYIDFCKFLIDYKDSITNKMVTKKLKVNQLKMIAKSLNLKTTATKDQLLETINLTLRKQYSVITLQKNMRKLLVQKWIKLHGPAFNNVTKCNNVSDFLTMEKLSDIPKRQLFSFLDKQGFLYGFNISSFNELYKSSRRSGSLFNPYNKDPIHKSIINKHLRLIQISNLLNINLLESDSPDDIQNLNETLEERALRRSKEIFMHIDTLGNYSDYLWFYELNMSQLRIFLRELYDIWNYRANISHIQKREICPGGDLFQNMQGRLFHVNDNIAEFQNSILDIIHLLVLSGINSGSQTLGSYYVLGALTIVNQNAANSLPWLYESFRL